MLLKSENLAKQSHFKRWIPLVVLPWLQHSPDCQLRFLRLACFGSVCMCVMSAEAIVEYSFSHVIGSIKTCCPKNLTTIIQHPAGAAVGEGCDETTWIKTPWSLSGLFVTRALLDRAFSAGDWQLTCRSWPHLAGTGLRIQANEFRE